MEITEPLTKLVIERRYWADEREVDKEVFQGEVTMSQDQQDAYKQIIGDGLAHVTVSKTMSEKDFGSGGEVFVSISLTCDQSAYGLDTAVHYARHLAEAKSAEHFEEMRRGLYQRGILKPR